MYRHIQDVWSCQVLPQGMNTLFQTSKLNHLTSAVEIFDLKTFSGYHLQTTGIGQKFVKFLNFGQAFSDCWAYLQQLKIVLGTFALTKFLDGTEHYSTY